jgi:hypothetical protein
LVDLQRTRFYFVNSVSQSLMTDCHVTELRIEHSLAKAWLMDESQTSEFTKQYENDFRFISEQAQKITSAN